MMQTFGLAGGGAAFRVLARCSIAKAAPRSQRFDTLLAKTPDLQAFFDIWINGSGKTGPFSPLFSGNARVKMRGYKQLLGNLTVSFSSKVQLR